MVVDSLFFWGEDRKRTQKQIHFAHWKAEKIQQVQTIKGPSWGLSRKELSYSGILNEITGVCLYYWYFQRGATLREAAISNKSAYWNSRIVLDAVKSSDRESNSSGVRVSKGGHKILHNRRAKADGRKIAEGCEAWVCEGRKISIRILIIYYLLVLLSSI